MSVCVCVCVCVCVLCACVYVCVCVCVLCACVYVCVCVCVFSYHSMCESTHNGEGSIASIYNTLYQSLLWYAHLTL